MNIDQLASMQETHLLRGVNFIESGSGPIVIEVEYNEGLETRRDLIKDDAGGVVTCRNVKEGYDLCLKAGIHRANLVQIITHDEACPSRFAEYHRDPLPLKF